MCFTRDLNRTPREWKLPLLPLAPACSVMYPAGMESTSNASSLGTDVMAYELFIVCVL